MTQKRISILGATGSIGKTTLELLRYERDRFSLEAITAMENVAELVAIAREFRPKYAVIGNPAHYETLQNALADMDIQLGAGESALQDAAAFPADIVLCAIVGAAGLRPTLAALRQGTTIALANKECLVCAGDVMLETMQKHRARILPVDSEHNAIFQVFDFARPETVDAIILTASGGPFRDLTHEQMRHVTLEQALKHPNWNMGAKITIDSATMMNKGLELIEAFYLFPVRAEQIEILVHPQSVIHSLVRYRDGSTLAQMGQPDMTIPIAYALSYPERMATRAKPLDLAKIGSLTFLPPDETCFPALRLAREALKLRGSAPIILNAANEAAVQAFLAQRVGFCDIADIVERVLQCIPHSIVTQIEQVLEVDKEARRLAEGALLTYG